MQAAESDFYRKKALTNPAVWKTIEGMTARSPDIHAWRGVTASSRRELRALCAADSQCQGFYTCSDFDAFNCTKILNEFHSEKNLTGVRAVSHERVRDAALERPGLCEQNVYLSIPRSRLACD